MKMDNTMKTNSVTNKLKGEMTKVINAFLILCTMFCFTALAQTNPNDPLDKDSAAVLIEELKPGLEPAIEDRHTLNGIAEHWSSRNLVGKTRKEAIDILFADVKSFVKDSSVLKKIWDSWNPNARGPDPVEPPQPIDTPKPVEMPEPKEIPKPVEMPETNNSPKPVETKEPTNTKPVITSTPPNATNPNGELVNRPATEDMIDLGAPPLSDVDMDKVMKWIAVNVSAERLPFCWKQSYGRTAGTPLTCKPGYNQDTAGLCYQSCKADEKGIATFCYKNCPQGLPDNGLYCEKRGEYGRGAGYVIWNEAKCNNENPQGCEKNGALWYPKCKPGYAAFGCCLCKPACPQGWEDIGVSCKKPNYARAVLPLTECPAGTERNGALCYPTCKTDFAGNGPVCWQQCPSQQSWDCGAACSTNQKECAFAVVNQVTAPIMAIISIASLGSASAITAPAKAAQVATSVTKLAAAAAKVKQALTAVKGSVEAMVGGAKALANISKAVSYGGKLYVAASAIGREVDLFSKEFADNFDAWTTPEIAKQIDQRFGKEAAFQIKRQWGLRHLTLMLEADGFATAKNVLTLVSIADPTGLVAVAAAFTQPICKSDTRFPTVTALYNR